MSTGIYLIRRFLQVSLFYYWKLRNGALNEQDKIATERTTEFICNIRFVLGFDGIFKMVGWWNIEQIQRTNKIIIGIQFMIFSLTK